MKSMSSFRLPSLSPLFALAIILGATIDAPALAVTIPTVPVGNAGNAPDETGYGAVAYDYRIGTTEVTNAQYAAFLNAKAASDPLGLYNSSMGSFSGGITRSGSDGAYTYAPTSGKGNLPVNFVSWYDAVRFANWLHNGQGNGSTETGAYTLLGGTPVPSNGASITRNFGARWFLTSEDEWYKAAYHMNNGVTGDYFEYPTSSDSAPIAQSPPGGANSANYDFAVALLTDTGAYVASSSPYLTFDQGGNVLEWTERQISGPLRGIRGGSASSEGPDPLSAAFASHTNGADEGFTFGFRVAHVPEPGSAVIAGLGALGLLLFRRRHRALLGAGS